MSSQSSKERKAKFNKPSNYLISPLSCVDSESMDTFFSYLENEYKLLGTKSKQIVNALKILKMSLSLRLLKKPKEEDKLIHTMINEFKDELKDLKNILNKIKN